MDMYNINHSFKQFTSMMAYVDSPVRKAISYAGLFGIDKGLLTVGDDGCISVWMWKVPQKSSGGKGRGGFSRGRGGYRGRGGRGGSGQGDQGM